MLYRTLADATMVVHLVFIGYVVFGGFLAWRWRRTIWLHLVAAGWGLGSVLIGFDCPLTYVENWARERGGEAELPSSGFIAHYLTGVVYPEHALNLVRALAAICVVVSWVGYALLRRRDRQHAAV
ncbi:MAG: DUF2784 domain-containing protein [Nocardiaceae bacterium]|nr:DUF2784 domain-containing protein [Nocardiaceae bacterium]